MKAGGRGEAALARRCLIASADAYARAQATAKAARDELRREVRHVVAAGMSESEAARLAGVSRLTVRSWLGKDK